MGQARRSGGSGTLLLLLAAGAGLLLYCNPEWVRAGRTQPPVGATVRDSLLGIGRVLRIKNEGEEPLRHVTVEATNPAHNTHVSYRFDSIAAHDTAELGWREWNWNIDPDETYKVSADGYALAITFSSAQLGLK